MKKPNHKLNTKAIKILLLQKDVTKADLMKEFFVKINTINKAINGARPRLHFRILDYLRSI